MGARLIFAILLCFSLTAATAQQQLQQGSTPVPDPTLLTTQAQEKAVAALKELLLSRIEAIEKEVKDHGAVLRGQEARTVLLLDRVPGEISSQLFNLQKLMEEKFKGVDQQFAGRDVALAAALLAQKTSVDEQNKANATSSAKSENATTKQIDGITSIITASQKANDDKIDAVKVLLIAQKQAVDAGIADLKDRISSAEARAIVTATANASRSEGGASAVNIAVISMSVLFGLIGAIGVIFVIVRGGSHNPRRS